ncbi:MAG: nucleotidyltransferase domain-containing protein [Anaerolineae bacterium]
MNAITKKKRAELTLFIQRVVEKSFSIQGIVVIGSVAKETARADSDIDAVVFLDPFDLYAVPAEAKWRSGDDSFHGIMSHVEDSIQLDFKRLDLAKWSNLDFEWSESMCAELSEGWIAFDRI